MDWWRNRQSVTKQEIKLCRFDLAAHVKTRMAHEALEIGADPVHDQFIYMQRDGDWYVEFGLEINAPSFVIEKLTSRGWVVL